MLIVDMPIPEKSCFECACIDSENGICQADKEQRYVDFNIPNWCPIKGEIVLCGECKWFDNESIGRCTRHEIRPTPFFMDDFFCADGERKEKDDA